VAGVSGYTAAAQLVRRVRDFAQRQPKWAECIVYRTLPDERWDMTLVSQRVYGNRGEFLTVMAAAGLDSVEVYLAERELVLPTARQLAEIKTQVGFVDGRFDRTAEQVADPIGTR
jgi:hypothetical protein